jgi:glutathione synthase/RimK-type ligase-like ATP-grasp enzyme
MIFLWGLTQDETISSVFSWLQKLNADFFFLDHSEINQTHITYSNNPSPSYVLHIRDEVIHFGDFTAAYLRPYNFKHYSHFEQSAKAITRAANVHLWISSWAESSKALIINRSSSECTNQSKLYQALIISSMGFKIPASLITNDYLEMLGFQTRYKKIIYKSMSSVRSIVKELSNLKDFESMEVGPVLLQEYISGKNIRVHVVGKKVFASLIETDQIDYRYAFSNLSHFELPADIAHNCVRLTEKLKLAISGIDLILTPEDEWFCLEVNPNPGFSFYENTETNEIARSLALLLIN